MDSGQHRQLADVLRSVRGMVILSGYDSPLYRELYADWRVDSCAARGEKAVARTEVLWMSPRAVRASGQILLTDSFISRREAMERDRLDFDRQMASC